MQKKLTELCPVLLRVTLGVIMTLHGAQKLGLFDQAAGWQATQASVQNFAVKLGALGLAPSLPLAWAVTMTEFIGGIFLMLGLATRFAALAMIVVMAVAIIKVHLPNGPIGRDGYGFNLLIAVTALTLVITGGGPHALDNFVNLKQKKK